MLFLRLSLFVFILVIDDALSDNVHENHSCSGSHLDNVSIGKNHKIKKGRHGVFLINSLDTYVGRSLDLYGEWSESELSFFSKFVKPGQTVLDVGANIGAFSIPLAKLVGNDGSVHSFEAQRVLSQILGANAVLNEIHNVMVYNVAVGEERGFADVPKILYSYDANYGAMSLVDTNWTNVGAVESIPRITLDDVFYREGTTCPSFIKIDVEGMELMVLRGAEKILIECKPVLYVENNCVMGSKELIMFLSLHGYTCHWDIHSYFSPRNFFGNKKSVFPENAYSVNMLCYHIDYDVSEIDGLQDITKIDVESQKFMLSQYALSMVGKENIILGQLGTREHCER